jgi:hypothetical protein
LALKHVRDLGPELIRTGSASTKSSDEFLDVGIDADALITGRAFFQVNPDFFALFGGAFAVEKEICLGESLLAVLVHFDTPPRYCHEQSP